MKKLYSTTIMFIKRWYSFSTIFLLFFNYASFIYTKAPDAEFSHYINPSQNQQLSNQIFSTFNCGVSSHKDSYYRHQNYVQAELNKCWILNNNGQYFLIQPDDAQLIEKICADNPHKPLDALRSSLARNPAINHIQNICSHQNKSGSSGFAQDIFIDKNHFKTVANSEQRIKTLMKAAQTVIDDRHKIEKNNLKSKHKTETKSASKKSKIIKKQIENRHEQELAALEKKHEEENKYPLGRKNNPVQNSTGVSQTIQAQAPVITSCYQQQVASDHVSKIATQELQNLYHQSKSVILNNQNVQSDSFNNVMHDRIQALEKSLSNVTPTIQQMKINPQTMGFLQAQGIDTVQFQQVEGLAIQHQLTYELIDVLDAVANYAQQYHHEMHQVNLTKYCAHLASLTQQSNIDGIMTEAVQGTNCCHGLFHYMNGIADTTKNKYEEMTTALQYFNPVLDYGAAIARGVAKGAVVTAGVIAVTAVGMAVAPAAAAMLLQATFVATAVTFAPLCLQVGINAYDFGKCCIAGDWEAVDQYLDTSYKFITDLENVERAAEIATGLAVGYNCTAIVQELQALSTMRPVFATVYQASGQVTRSVGLMTAVEIEQEIIAAAEILQNPEFSNFNLVYENIFGCDFFTLAPQTHPALAPILEIAGMPGMMNLAEQELMTQACLTLSQVSSSSSLMTMNINQAAQEQIRKAAFCLSKVVSDLVQKGIGLENLSYDEIDLIARVVKKARNIDIHRSGNLSNVNVQFSKNINHLFKDRKGHLPNTIENQNRIMILTKNVINYFGSDCRGNDWYGEILMNGTQLWSQVRDEIIINCGLNITPKPFNPITGLSELISPTKK